VTDKERYHRLLERMQWAARRLLIFGLHVHVGAPDGETAIQVVNHLEPWLPHLLALTASSPLWQGRDTGLASTRIKIFESLPTAGLPYRHHNWHEFEQLLEALIRAQTVESIRETWWDVRPHPHFGTVEVRICDMPPTLADSVAIAALIQALVVHLQREVAEGASVRLPHNRIVRENKWRATRWSTRGSTIVDEEGKLEPISESITKLLEKLRPVFTELGSEAEVARLEHLTHEGPSYARQRAVHEKAGDLKAVVDSLIREAERSGLENREQ
jgi:carboxylate-amine ligase